MDSMTSFDPWDLPPLPESPIVSNTVLTLRETVISPVKTTSNMISRSPSKYEHAHAHVNTRTTSVSSSPNKAMEGMKTSPLKRYDAGAQTYRTLSKEDHRRSGEQETEREGDNTRTLGFPRSSPRKPVSPTKVPLPPSPTYGAVLSPHRPGPTNGRDSITAGESSFMFPSNMSDSLVGETSMPTMMMDHSLDFGIDSVRKGPGSGLPGKHDMGYATKKDGDSVSGSLTPTKVTKGSMTPTATARRPVTTADNEGPRTVAPSSVQRVNRELTSPSKTPRSRMGTSAYTTTSTLASTHHSLPRHKRHADLDVSTLLPSSPARTAHLLSDKHHLLRESLPSSESEDESFFLPPMPNHARKSPRKPNGKADMTMDIGDLMAKMAKPKRPSGTEESFEDLLNAPGFELDQSMIGNETFLPPDLRPSRQVRQSPVKHTPARIRNAAQLDPERSASSPVRSVRRELPRSSPSKQELPKSNTRASAFASPRRLAPVPSPIRPSNPAQTTSATPRMVASARDSAAAVPSPRRTAQPPVGNRRVSLSMGALHLPSSESGPRPGHGRSGSTTAAITIATTAVPRSAALERTSSSRTAAPASSRGISPPKPTSMEPPARSAVTRPPQSRTGSTATLTGVAQRSRIGSTLSSTTVGSVSSRVSNLRPSTQAHPPKSSLPPPTARSTATARPVVSTTTAKSGLPQPGTGSSARSALSRPTGSSTTTSKVFGADGSATTNRLSARPTTTSSSASTSASARLAITGKMSMAPPAMPARPVTTSALNSRAISTPAQATLTRGLPRPLTKTSITPPNGGRSTAASSTLPRPPTSRMPAAASASGMAGASSRLPSAASRNSANITALRARIDALSARQAVTRR